MNRKDYIKSLKITGIVLFIFFVFWTLFSIQPSFGYSGTGTTHDLKTGSRFNGDLLAQPFAGSITIFFGTQSTSPIGTGNVGYIGTNTAGLPKIKYTYLGGSSTITLDGFTHVAVNGSDIPLSGSVSAKLDAINGVGTGNTFNNVTIAGQGTTTATINYNGANISPTEVSYLDGMSENISSKLATVTGSVTNHTHTGSDGTTKISHTDLTPASKGTQTHTQIDDFIASKAQASGLASLNASSLVVQNPASGTSTPGVSKIIISLVTGVLDDSWLSSTISKLGADIQIGTETTGNTDNLSEGNTNKYYTDARVNTAVGSLSVDALNDVNIISPADGHKLTYDLATGKWIAATSSASIAFSGVTGSATDNTNFSQTPQANKVKVPVSDNSGKLTWNWLGGITGTATTSIGTTTVNLIVSDPNSILLLHFDSTNGTTTFKNDGYGTMTITAQNGAAISTADKKFGVSSSLYDGVNDNAVVATSPLFTLAAGSKWDFSVELNPTNIGNDDGIFAFKSDKIQIYFRSGLMRTLLGTTTTSSTLPPTGQWTQLYISYDGVVGRTFRGGIQLGTATLSDTYVFDDGGLGLLIGEETTGSSLYMYDGYMDEMRFRVNPTTNFYTGNFGSTTAAYGGGGIAYTENTLSLFDTATNIPVLKFVTPGTATAEKSYTFLPGSVTVFGATSTASIGTTTPGLAYGVPNAGAATFDAFNVHSIGEIKAGIENLAGKENDQKSKLLKMNSKSWHPKVRDVYILDAEAVAKDEYIRKDYTLWESANKNKYISSVEMPGTGTVQVLNSQQMMLDYKAEKELSWASDLKQPLLIKETQDILESDETITRLGFMVHDPLTPKEVIEGEAINLMSVIALAVDAIKAQENEIGSLTAALENQKIAYNEEVDNLYKLVNAIIVALLAVGGVSGWSTFRTKRKGT